LMRKLSRKGDLALNYLLHVPGSSLKKMFVSGGRREYFVVLPNGGMVAEEDALAIIARPEVCIFEDGLFPGNPQSWSVRRGAANKQVSPGRTDGESSRAKVSPLPSSDEHWPDLLDHISQLADAGDEEDYEAGCLP
jgi:hypothetical protein